MPSPSSTERIKAKRLPDNGFKRAQERYALELEVALRVYLPNTGTEPRLFTAKSGDVSAFGMGVCVENLPVRLYSQLLTKTPPVRIEFADPISGSLVERNGKLAWIDYRKTKASDDSGPCRLGIRFTPEFGAEKSFQQFFDRIEAA